MVKRTGVRGGDENALLLPTGAMATGRALVDTGMLARPESTMIGASAWVPMVRSPTGMVLCVGLKAFAVALRFRLANALVILAPKNGSVSFAWSLLPTAALPFGSQTGGVAVRAWLGLSHVSTVI